MLPKPLPNDASDIDITLTDPHEMPQDTVSCISWAPSTQTPTFATSDWNSQIRIYNVNSEDPTLSQKTYFDTESPCLSVSWHHTKSKVFSGCTNGSVGSFDVETGRFEEIGLHEGIVKDVYWMESANALLTLSFDKTLRFWDPRQAGHVAGFKLDHKPFCSDLVDGYLAMGMSEEKLLVLRLCDIENVLGRGSRGRVGYLDSPVLGNSQISCVRIIPTGGGDGELKIGVSGMNGRCNLSKMKTNLGQWELTTVTNFKIHKKTIENRELQYPTNCLCFHPKHQSWDFICSAGGEGMMYFMDMEKKARIVDFDFKGVPVTQVRFDPTGEFLAYSLGYDWAKGIHGYMSQPTKLCVHVMQEKERYSKFETGLEYPIKYPKEVEGIL